jgi:hypothetical protein
MLSKLCRKSSWEEDQICHHPKEKNDYLRQLIRDSCSEDPSERLWLMELRDKVIDINCDRNNEDDEDEDQHSDDDDDDDDEKISFRQFTLTLLKFFLVMRVKNDYFR